MSSHSRRPLNLSPEDTLARRREKGAQRMAELRARQASMTRLELAAFATRHGAESPYTPAELEDALAIRALLEQAEAMAKDLAARVKGRLGRSQREMDQILLDEFLRAKAVRVEVTPF